MTIQQIQLHFLQHLVDQLVHHLEQYHREHQFNMMQFHVVVKLVLLLLHIDSHIEGEFIKHEHRHSLSFFVFVYKNQSTTRITTDIE